MNHSIVMLIIFLSACFNANAQVNLDAPINSSIDGKLYMSAFSEKVAYYIPVFLEIDPSIDIKIMDRQAQIYFNAGAFSNKLTQLQSSLKDKYGDDFELRVVRAFNIVLDDRGSFDIAPRYKSTTEGLGDLGNLLGPIPFVLSLYNAEQDIIQRINKTILSGGPAMHLGTLYYEFNAVSDGKPYQAKTSVSIFSTTNNGLAFPSAVEESPNKKTLAKGGSPATDSGGLASSQQRKSSSILDNMRDLISGVVGISVSRDQFKNCWSDLKPGEVCIK